MQIIAFDAHKRYTLARAEDQRGKVIEEGDLLAVEEDGAGSPRSGGPAERHGRKKRDSYADALLAFESRLWIQPTIASKRKR